MNTVIRIMMAAVLLIFISSRKTDAQMNKKIILHIDKSRAEIRSSMWGIFFEDINMGADGGIYAELIKNRSFEFFKPMIGWTSLGKPETEGDFLVLNRQQNNPANPRLLWDRKTGKAY